ncbi:AAA family ATPase [Ottowia sp.]|uniref:AAA family ATPase n=1 Tax=Ottowia sp. TaxID=1898956 RepID=UPI0039E33C28
MLPIKFANPSRRYSSSDLKTQLRLVVSNGSPSASHGTPSQLGTHQHNPFLNSYPDGERTAALTKVVGFLLSQGLPVDMVGQMALDWSARQNPPLDADKVRRTVESLAKTDARNHPERHKNLPLAPLFDISEADISPLLRTSPPPRRWLLRDMLPLGIVGMLVAPGGTGKSQFVLQMGVTVATGIPLCGVWQVGERGKALLLLAEDEIDEVQRRLNRIITELSPSHPAMAADLRQGLLIKSLTARNNLMTRAQRRGDVEATDYVDRLLLTVAGIPDLKLIVIDPASRFRGGDENSADDATRFVEQLERVRHATGATVLVCHHVNKASMNPASGTRGQSATRGSSAMTDGVRWQLNLASPGTDAKKGLDASKHYLSAELTKSNYGPPIDAEILIRKPNGYLVGLRAGGTPVTLEDRVLQLIRDEATLGKSYSASQIENTFGGENGTLKTGKVAVRKAIKALLNAGTIRRIRGKLVAMPDKPINLPPATGSIP